MHIFPYAKLLVGLLALGLAASCGTDGSPDSSDLPELPDDETPDPIAGLYDDCHHEVRRGLYDPGNPYTVGKSGISRTFDPDAGTFGKLALYVAESATRTARGSTFKSDHTTDARCRPIADALHDNEVASDSTHKLAAAQYPDGKGEIDLSIELEFDVDYPTSPADITPRPDASTVDNIVVQDTALQPSRMALVITYLRPGPDDLRSEVKEQRFDMQFQCTVPYPFEVAWRQTIGGRDHAFCPRNAAGTKFCLTYELRHGGGDCKFAVPDLKADTIFGARIEASLAGSLTRLFDDGSYAGTQITVDTIALPSK